MAAFDPSAELSHPVDYRLVADGFVTPAAGADLDRITGQQRGHVLILRPWS